MESILKSLREVLASLHPVWNAQPCMASTGTCRISRVWRESSQAKSLNMKRTLDASDAYQFFVHGASP